MIKTDNIQVLSTCRRDGRLLSPGRGLTVTPLQVKVRLLERQISQEMLPIDTTDMCDSILIENKTNLSIFATAISYGEVPLTHKPYQLLWGILDRCFVLLVITCQQLTSKTNPRTQTITNIKMQTNVLRSCE